jgi:predicted phosphodiesterase
MNTLVIGDIHCPADHPGYLAFCQHLQEQYRCDDVVFIGDVVDHHAVSFHAANPECPGPKDEFELAYQQVGKWYNAFPTARVCIGNHDERIMRLAESVNIPAKYLRNYSEVWETPGWQWDYEFTDDKLDIYYFHGTGNGGIHPAYNAAKKMLMSVVMGHLHSAGGVKWLVNPNRRIFALDTGCGIDPKAMQFAYGKHLKTRPVLSAAVIVDGDPLHRVMPCSRGEAFHRSRFTKKRRRA